MRNQTSFRLTTTLLPTDMTAKTTTVINKVDSNGDKFYPTFTEETVVLTNDDRTVMETTRAICTDGVLTFIKRGLSDDASETQVPNRKLTWNPGSLCFITAGAGDWIDKDDNITWTGNQTYTGNLVSQGNATYNGLLTTNKGVKYPSFASLAELEAYNDPFPGMFAVLESNGELYRYNAITEQRDVVTTSTPAVPEQASTVAIGTVRGATDEELEAGTGTGSQGELLIATPAQLKTAMSLHITDVNLSSGSVTSVGQSKSVTWTVPHDGFVSITWVEYGTSASKAELNSCDYITISGTSNPVRVTGSRAVLDSGQNSSTVPFALLNKELYVVRAGTLTATIKFDFAIDWSYFSSVRIDKFFYFGL